MECPEHVEKKSDQSNTFWVSYGPLKCVYKWSKVCFIWITPEILTFEYYTKNKTYSEVNFICEYQIWSKFIEKWPPNSQDGRHDFFFFCHFNIRPRGFPAHHHDRLVYFIIIIILFYFILFYFLFFIFYFIFISFLFYFYFILILFLFYFYLIFFLFLILFWFFIYFSLFSFYWQEMDIYGPHKGSQTSGQEESKL